MKNYLITALILFVALTSFSQSKIKMGEFDEKYFSMTHCPFDSSAGAFIIKSYGLSRLDFNYEIEFKYHGIIKILNSDEYDRANVKIRYFKGDRISNFKAVSYNVENGKVVSNELKRKDAVIEKVNDDINSFNFTFPDVKEGTIIEYTYTALFGDLTKLNTWYFQRSIPTIRSQYQLSVPAFFEYERMFQSYFPLEKADVKVEQKPFGGTSANWQVHNYVALNVPAFKDEPYITTTDDYISKIGFELKRYTIPGQQTKTYLPSDFGVYAKQLYESDNWGGSIQDVKFVEEVVEVLKSQSNTDLELASNIYYYVRDNFEEDFDADFERLVRVWNEKKGESWQINRILGAMLNSAGFKTHLVRISTRSNGRVNKFIPIARQFNFTIVKTTVGEKELVLDATDKNTPFETLPKYCLNGEGLVIKPTLEWVPLKPNKLNGITYNSNLELSEDGILSGDLTIRRTGYNAWSFKKKMKEENGEEDHKEAFNENRENWIIDEHSVGELDENNNIDEKLVVEIDDKLDDLGDIAYLSPIVIGQTIDNPFKKPERTFPVDYGAPFTETHLYKITIDSSFIIDEVPTPKSVALPNRGGRLLYNVTVNGNVINIMNRIQIQKSQYPANEYIYLREFYAQIVEKHGEQIVLKRK